MIQNHTFKAKFTTKIELSQEKSLKTHKNSADLTVVYIHGLFSDPWGRKPEEVKSFCEENNLNFCRFELVGHGSDKDNYENIDFNDWKNQVLEVLDELVHGDVIMIGSSLGGWLSLVSAKERPNRVKGVIGLAAAPDFTYDIEQYIFTPEQKTEMKEKGKILFPMKDFTYIFTSKIFDTARENLLLNKELPITCPVHLLQGSEDKNVMPDKPFKIMKCLSSDDVVVKIIKGGNHRLGRDIDIAEMKKSLASMCGL